MKQCIRCGENKEEIKFSIHTKNGRLHNVCKECHSIYRREHYLKNHEKYKTKARKWKKENPLRHVFKVYKLERFYSFDEFVERYELAKAAQLNICAICEEVPDDGLVVDHCHDTGKFRGLLCGRCNRALGSFRDSKKNLLKAIEYLER